MRKSCHCLLLGLFLMVTAHAQSIVGDWEGVLKIGAREVPWVLHIAKDEQGGLKATVDSPSHFAFGIPVTAISLSGSILKFAIPMLGSYEGKVNVDGTTINGTLTQRSTTPLDFRRAKTSAVTRENLLLKRTVTVGKNTYGYRVFLPENFDAKRSYPAVLYLHGAAGRGRDNESQTFSGVAAAIRSDPKKFDSFIAVFPQAPENGFWVGETVEQAIQALEQTVAEFNADRERLYLFGLSMGGFGAWYTAANYPGKFAAVLIVAGGIFPPGSQNVPPELRSFVAPDLLRLYDAKDPYDAFSKRIGKTPVWIFHGTEDQTVPVGDARKMTDALKNAKGNVKYNEYAGGGHNISSNVFAETELWKWLLTQRLNR